MSHIDLRRAPGPTLHTCGLGLIFMEWVGNRARFVAHRGDTSPERAGLDVTICGKRERQLRAIEPEAAAYIAVPCRECFPGTPPPGWRNAIPGFRHDDALANESGHVCDPSLAWQVADKS